jgi:hypothetical protein
MKCVGCYKEIKKGEFVVMNGGALVKTKTGARMGDNLDGFLTIHNHFDSKKNYKSMNLAFNKPNGQFEFYACSHKCLAKYMTRNIMLLEKLNKIKKIEMAPSKKVKKAGKWVDLVLEAIGFKRALVTDESRIFDFFDFGSDQKREDKLLSKWSKKLGFKIKEDDRIWKVAEKLSKGNYY